MALNLEVAAAVARLRAEGVLSDPQATLFGRVARRELVSVRIEIRTLLYAGVLLLTSGVGALVAAHHERIGPLALSIAIGLAAAGCLLWVARVAPAFSWGEVASPSLAFDYVLLLGVLLFAADLAYVEAQFTMLGPRWPRYGDSPLQPVEVGNVYTLELGVLTSAGYIGLEEDVLVTAQGCEFLSEFQREPILI